MRGHIKLKASHLNQIKSNQTLGHLGDKGELWKTKKNIENLYIIIYNYKLYTFIIYKFINCVNVVSKWYKTLLECVQTELLFYFLLKINFINISKDASGLEM